MSKTVPVNTTIPTILPSKSIQRNYLALAPWLSFEGGKEIKNLGAFILGRMHMVKFVHHHLGEPEFEIIQKIPIVMAFITWSFLISQDTASSKFWN